MVLPAQTLQAAGCCLCSTFWSATVLAGFSLPAQRTVFPCSCTALPLQCSRANVISSSTPSCHQFPVCAVQVETADQRQLLCLLPARFHKKLWIRRGSFVIIREGNAAEGEAKVTATIEAILQVQSIEHAASCCDMAGLTSYTASIRSEGSTVAQLSRVARSPS